MRCKGCNSPLMGSQMDVGLCSDCREVSNYNLREAETATEEVQPSNFELPNMDLFEDYVKARGLLKSWSEVSGVTSMSSEARCEALQGLTWQRYCDWLGAGLSHDRALREATGLNRRGNQIYAVSGRKGGSDSLGAEGGERTIAEEAYMSNDMVGWSNLWSDK